MVVIEQRDPMLFGVFVGVPAEGPAGLQRRHEVAAELRPFGVVVIVDAGLGGGRWRGGRLRLGVPLAKLRREVLLADAPGQPAGRLAVLAVAGVRAATAVVARAGGRRGGSGVPVGTGVRDRL